MGRSDGDRRAGPGPSPWGFGCGSQGNKKQPSAPAAALPENPAERISFCFSSKAFAVVFHGWEEQKPRVAIWLLPGSPLLSLPPAVWQ